MKSLLILSWKSNYNGKLYSVIIYLCKMYVEAYFNSLVQM